MIFELRAYDLIPGKAPDYIELFRKDGVQYVTRHLPMGGYWLTDSGMLNRLYHLWIYESLEERMECRAGLAADADWNTRFVPKGFPLILSQRNMLMEVTEASSDLQAVVAARRASHAGQGDADPMFGPDYLSLTSGPALADGAELLGRWRCVSGENPGRVTTLYRHRRDDPFSTAPGAERHELLRALSCSPLR